MWPPLPLIPPLQETLEAALATAAAAAAAAGSGAKADLLEWAREWGGAVRVGFVWVRCVCADVGHHAGARS